MAPSPVVQVLALPLHQLLFRSWASILWAQQRGRMVCPGSWFHKLHPYFSGCDSGIMLQQGSMVRLYRRLRAGRKEGERKTRREREQELSPRSCSFHDLLLFIRYYLIFLLQIFSKSCSQLGTNLSLLTLESYFRARPSEIPTNGPSISFTI